MAEMFVPTHTSRRLSGLEPEVPMNPDIGKRERTKSTQLELSRRENLNSPLPSFPPGQSISGSLHSETELQHQSTDETPEQAGFSGRHLDLGGDSEVTARVQHTSKAEQTATYPARHHQGDEKEELGQQETTQQLLDRLEAEAKAEERDGSTTTEADAAQEQLLRDQGLSHKPDAPTPLRPTTSTVQQFEQQIITRPPSRAVTPSHNRPTEEKCNWILRMLDVRVNILKKLDEAPEEVQANFFNHWLRDFANYGLNPPYHDEQSHKVLEYYLNQYSDKFRKGKEPEERSLLKKSIASVTDWAATRLDKYLPDIGSASNLPDTGTERPVIDITSPTPAKPKAIAPKTPKKLPDRLQPIDTRRQAVIPSSSKTPTKTPGIRSIFPPKERRYPYQPQRTPQFTDVHWTPPKIQQSAHQHNDNSGQQRNLPPPPQDEDEIPISPKTPKRRTGIIRPEKNQQERYEPPR